MSDPFKDAERFDYVIVGGGSAGCVLANRLSADPSARVLVVEAGRDGGSVWLKIPAGYMRLIGNPRFDWCFMTAVEPGLNNRSIACPRGKALGGSSVMNGMFQVRGQADDYDHWRQLGLTGWGWSDVLPYFKAHEDFVGGAGPVHGAGGELRVELSRVSWPVLDIVREAAMQDGLPLRDDFNTGEHEGVGPMHVTQKKGVRWSARRAFLEPALRRKNLKVESEAMAGRVLFDGKRAIGIEYRKGGEKRVALASREVIMAAGAIGTPQILMLSGVGPAAHLRERDINVVLDKPGIGGNLQDHLQMRVSYRLEGVPTLNQRYNSIFGKLGMALEYAAFRTGPMTMAPSTLGIFAKSDPRRDRPNLGFNALPFSRKSGNMSAGFHPFPGVTMCVYDLQLSVDAGGPGDSGRCHPGVAADHAAAGAGTLQARGNVAGAADQGRRRGRVA
jgi:choline dehydrogenase